MATYHLSLKNGIVGTAKNHVEYILRLGRYSDKSRKEELKYQNSNLPHWANDAVEFFEKADIYERTNGRAYIEFEIALPNEIALQDNVNILERFIENNIGKNKVWAYAVHSKGAAFDDSQEQIHAHIMFSERIVTDEMEEALNPSKFFKRYNPKNPDRGGYKKDRRYSDKKCSSNNLKNVRKDWEILANKKYEEKNINKRISCESLKKQKEDAEKIFDYALASLLDRTPQEHLGPKVTNIVKKTLKNKNINQDNLDDVLDDIYLISTKAFCLVIDQLEKEKKEIEYLNLMKQREMIDDNHINDADYVCLDEEEVIKIEGRGIANIVNTMEENLIKKITANDEVVRRMKKLLFSEKQIGFMALSICTKGLSKKLMKKRRILDKRRKNYEEELRHLINGNKPYFWQFEERRKYDKKIEETSILLGNVEQELNSLRMKAEEINELMTEEINKKRMLVVINKLKERQKVRIEYIESVERQQLAYLDISDKCGILLHKIDTEKNYRVPRKLYRGLCNMRYDDESSKFAKGLYDLERMMSKAEKENRANIGNRNNLKINLDSSKGKQPNQFSL